MVGPFLPGTGPPDARAELLRRFLRCYGPAIPAHFASWLGVRVHDTQPWWRLLADELVPVHFGARCWIGANDLLELHSMPPPTWVRMLPPRGPYTQMPDRETIVERKHHREIWRAVGEPGTLLVHGNIVGTWRARKAGKRLDLSMRAFAPITEPDREGLVHEADQIAGLRGTKTGYVRFETN